VSGQDSAQLCVSRRQKRTWNSVSPISHTIGLKILALSSPSVLFLTRVTSTALGLVLCLANRTEAAPNCDVWRVTVPDS